MLALLNADPMVQSSVLRFPNLGVIFLVVSMNLRISSSVTFAFRWMNVLSAYNTGTKR